MTSLGALRGANFPDATSSDLSLLDSKTSYVESDSPVGGSGGGRRTSCPCRHVPGIKNFDQVAIDVTVSCGRRHSDRVWRVL